MTIYDKVKKAADAKGMSIAEVERKAGVSNGTVSKWKSGKPRVETLFSVAKALDVEFFELLPGMR